MFCIKCGSKLEQGDKFCPSCGFPVSENNEPKDKQQIKTQGNIKNASVKPFFKNKKVMTICCITFSLIVLVSIILGLTSKKGKVWDGSVAKGFAGGSGSKTDPYIIKNGAQLAYLAQEVNDGNDFERSTFKLASDIYLNDTRNWEKWGEIAPANEWTAIGWYEWDDNKHDHSYTYFSGTFNGDGHKIFGLYINIYETDYTGYCQGLFGCCDGTIKNLGVEKSFVHGYQSVGGVVGYIGDGRKGILTNCYNAGNVKGNRSNSWYIGGVVGYNNGTISCCYNTGDVVGCYELGGIAGRNEGKIIDCYNTGSIAGDYEKGEWIGGIVGYNHAYFGDEWYYDPNERIMIESCYNIGNVAGKRSTIGGIAGVNESKGFISNCYYLDTCCAFCAGSIPIGRPLTDKQMRDRQSYSGFDFDKNWTMKGKSDYPYPELVNNAMQTR